ncbi:MAG: hypothetical protein LBI65_02515, partial [Candidatus Symbiothrix sp.]|nr:hypothetical protein [Candidatus Symbiothrix sp.]
MSEGIDFEIFREKQESGLGSVSGSMGSRPPYETEYQINDWMSFMCFLNLTLADDIRDCCTGWHF